MKILVIDDERDIEPLFRQQFSKEMKAERIDFHFAYSANEALEYLGEADRAEVVLILADIHLPDMNGLELLRMLKERNPAIRVFMITVYGGDDNYRKAIEYGADEFICKPIDFKKLKEKISDMDAG